MKTFKTPKGTDLPLLNLKGKDYLQVAHRLVWFREERPEWTIETAFIELTPTGATAKAIIRDKEGRIISTAHKTEDKQGFADFKEKAETGAIGRALAHSGFGTQFAPELEEGERIVDSPVPPKARPTAALVGAPPPEEKEFIDPFKVKKSNKAPARQLYPAVENYTVCPECGAEGRLSQYGDGKYYCTEYKNGCKARWVAKEQA